jgi:aspartate/methionine/tyrosine aminotransferase
MAYVTALMTLVDAGDEIILPVPWYVLPSSVIAT